MLRLERILTVTGALSLLELATWCQASGCTPLAERDPAESSWYGQVNEEIRASEYHWSPVEGEDRVWSAPNRSQGLRSRVSSEGLEVFPRVTSAAGTGAPWKLVLRTRSFGRQGFARELARGALATDGARAELATGSISEWFENRPEGIEQGWTIASAPSGAEPLWIGLEVRGDLSLRIEDGARSGVFVDARGEARLRYRDLKVRDATGRELEARLRPSPEGVGIAVEDLGAVYPVVVDPLLTDPAWTAGSGQASAGFGVSVSMAGDVNGDGYGDVIVGAYLYDNGQQDEGRAYVYHGSASGLGTSAAWIVESDQEGSQFGVSVSMAGDVNGDGHGDVIVGAHAYDGGQVNEGRAYVYQGSPSGLATGAAWSAEPDLASCFFGYSVAAARDVNGDGYADVIVGAYGYDDGQVDEGRAYVFHGSAAGLSTSAAWTAEANRAGALFGSSVSAAGDVNGDGYGDVIVGALAYDNGEAYEGRAYVYHGSAAGLAPSADWSAESNQASALFGGSVSAAGDVNGDGYGDVIVGAYFYDNGEPDEGRAYVYHGSAAGLGTSAAWSAESDQASASFGRSVSGAGDRNGDGYSDVIVGADGYDNGELDEGRAYFYHGSASGLTASAAWTVESDQASAHFGNSVSETGDLNHDGYGDVIIGAYAYDNGVSDAGRAYVYHGSSSGPGASAAWTGEPDQLSGFGVSVSTAGDVNGDGYGDVIVGAPFHDNGQDNEGRAYVYHGSASGLGSSLAWTVESNQGFANFGFSVSGAGDVNGDGHDDVIVGAPAIDSQRGEGSAYLYHGSASGLATSVAWTADSDQGVARFGVSVSAAGDVNGDGYGDVVVGAYAYDNGEIDEGRAYVYHGSPVGLGTSAAWTAESGQAIAYFGSSVSAAGDVNGDGYGDVIVGAYFYDNEESGEGRAYVYHGSGAGLSTSAAWTVESGQGHGGFGNSVSAAGDVNGDGYGDVIVGAYGYDNGQDDEGRAYVYHGSGAGLSTSAAWTAESDQAYGNFGARVSAAGDVDGDGYGDVMVGARYDGTFNGGHAYVYQGSASGLATSVAWSADSDQSVSVSAAGDVNGDGYGDVMVGASWSDRAFVHHGNELGGPTLAPRQRRLSGGPMAILDRSDAVHAFRLTVDFDRDLAGYSWAKPVTSSARLQWEVEPLGGTFDGIPDGESASQVVTGATLVFDQIIVGLGENMPCTWRARIATDNPLFPNTSWFTVQAKPVTETKFRTKEVHDSPRQQSGPPSGTVTRTGP